MNKFLLPVKPTGENAEMLKKYKAGSKKYQKCSRKPKA
jgi:hypothetical protein